MNRVCLIGNLTKDGELRTTASGTEVFKFTLAVKRDFKNDSDTFDVDYINCIAFNQTAVNLSKFTQKGHKVAVDGRIQTGSYDAQDGTKRYTTDIIVDKFTLLTPKKDSESNNHEIVAQVVNEEKDPFEEFSLETPFTEDDLPF